MTVKWLFVTEFLILFNNVPFSQFHFACKINFIYFSDILIPIGLSILTLLNNKIKAKPGI